MYGHKVSHSKRRTNRVFKPNLHEARILVGTNRQKVRLCTKCLRLYKTAEKLSLSPQPQKDAPEETATL